MTPQQEQDMRVLEYIYDNDDPRRGGADVGGLYRLVGDDQALTSAVSLKNRGLIRNALSMAGGYHIEAAGRSEVESMRARRRDRAHRRAECREQFLSWVDAHTTTSAGSRVGREGFTGSADLLAFSEEEVVGAAEHLAERGLIKSVSAFGGPHILVYITERGRDCTDAGRGIPAFLDKPERGGQTLHISGSGNNVAAAVGDNNEVTATLNQFDPEMARQFAEAVRQAMPVLDLPDDVEAMLQDIEQTEDPSRAQLATAALYNLVIGTTSGGLGQVLGTVGASALGIS